MGRFVLGELALIRYADGLSAPGRDAVGPVAGDGVAVIEVEETWSEADSEVRRGHLVVRRVAGHVVEEVKEGLKGLAVLVWEEQQDALHGVRAKFRGYVYIGK